MDSLITISPVCLSKETWHVRCSTESLAICQMSQKALEDIGELCLAQVDLSATFDRVNHAGLLHKLRSVGIGGSVLNIIEHFLANRTQRVVIDGVASSSVPVISGVPQGSVLGPLLFLVYTSEQSELQ